MRLVFLADTHNHDCTHLVPDGDILIHCGDATGRGTATEVIKFLNWFGALPHPHKIFVAGNHDWLYQDDHTFAKGLTEEQNIHYLEDRRTEIEGIRFYGTPWQPVFCDWAFNLYEEDLEERFLYIPQDVQVLITHGPPFGVLDENTFDFKITHIGSRALAERLHNLRDLRIHAFGHNHSGYGTLTRGGVQFINAATCNRHYQPVNPPIVVDL